jgi:hypothetical protein
MRCKAKTLAGEKCSYNALIGNLCNIHFAQKYRRENNITRTMEQELKLQRYTAR